MNQEILLTVSEFAKVLRVDDTTVRRWIQTGHVAAVALPHSRKRRSYRIKRSVLDAILQPAEGERKVHSEPEKAAK